MSKDKDIKAIIAKNITKYRKAKGLTQLQIGSRLHYSDKTVSKWERGESIPDIFVLKSLADIYGISVSDFFKDKMFINPMTKRKRRVTISLLSAALVLFIIILIFTIFAIFIPGFHHPWLILLYGLPIILFVESLLNIHWENRMLVTLFLSLTSTISVVDIYLSLLLLLKTPHQNLWLVLLSIPLLLIIIFLINNLGLPFLHKRKLKNENQN